MSLSDKDVERNVPAASIADEKDEKDEEPPEHPQVAQQEPVDENDISSNSDDPVQQVSNKPPSRTSSKPSRLRNQLSRQQSALSAIRNRNPASNQPFTHQLENQQTGSDVVVDFDGHEDPYKPLNWPYKKKIITTALYGFTTMGSTFASSVYSAGVEQVAHDFHVSNEVSILGITLLLLGFGLGPLLWAPLSEVYGRKSAVLVPYLLAAIFSFGTATAKDIQTVMITRFFAGFFGSAPITNT